MLHPGLGVEGGYDTNFFYADNPVGAGRLRITAHLDLATRSPQRTEDEEGVSERGTVSFRLGAAVAYLEPLSQYNHIQNHRNADISALLNLHILPGRTFSIILNDIYTRATEPRNQEGLPVGEEPIYTYNRDTNSARLAFVYSPGGQTFDLRFGYGFRLRYFEDGSPSLAYLGNYTSHEGFVNMRWRFLPKTALLFTGSFNYISHQDGTVAGAREVHDSYNVRGAVGLVGLFTRRFSLLLQVGYGAGFYTGGGPDYDNFLGKLELRFHVTPTARISLGYSRDFFDSVFSDYYTRDRVTLSYDHLIAGRVMLALSAGFSYLDYAQFTDPTGSGTTDRADPMLDGMLFVEYRIRDWLAINATVRYLGNLTSFVSTAGTVEDPGSFHQVMVLGGVRAMY